MKNTSPASELIAAVSRRSFFGRAAVAGSAVLLGSSIPSKVGAEDKKDKKEDQEKNEKKGKKEEESQCGSPGLCDFPIPIPHINTPPPGGGHFYFPGPVDGSAAATDPSGAHPEGRDPSVIFNFKGFVGVEDLNLTGTGTELHTG